MNRTLLKSKHSCEFSAAKKIYYSVLVMLCGISGYAANCVSTTQVSANYQTQQVTFKLTWTGCNGTTHLNKVWCLVDFQPVDVLGNKGAWQRATVSGTPTVTNGTYTAGNTTGFYVTGVNGQSATVTVKLGNVSGMFNWCATATDYPPNLQFPSSTEINKIVLHGTPPFVLTDSGGSVTTIGNANPYTFYNTQNKIYAIITDRTNCPGFVNCTSSSAPKGLCTGSVPAFRIISNQ